MEYEREFELRERAYEIILEHLNLQEAFEEFLSTKNKENVDGSV